MEGAKNDRPTWINNTFNQFVKEIVRDGVDPLVNLSNSINELEESKINVNDLKISVKLSKDPDQYTVNHAQKKIGLKLNLKTGDVIQYYKSDNEDGISLDPNYISIRKYKTMLWNSVKDLLEVAGYDITAIERKFVVNNCSKPRNIGRLSEVANM